MQKCKNDKYIPADIRIAELILMLEDRFLTRRRVYLIKKELRDWAKRRLKSYQKTIKE